MLLCRLFIGSHSLSSSRSWWIQTPGHTGHILYTHTNKMIKMGITHLQPNVMYQCHFFLLFFSHSVLAFRIDHRICFKHEESAYTRNWPGKKKEKKKEKKTHQQFFFQWFFKGAFNTVFLNRSTSEGLCIFTDVMYSS